MDRKSYLRMRQTGQMDLSIFYQYYLQNHCRGPRIDYATFSQTFQVYVQAHAAAVFKYLDSKFNITVLLNKDGQELKFY